MTELRSQLGEARVPGCLVTCVGGGGLALGLLQGLDTCTEAWRHVPVVAMETFGANCLSEVEAAILVTCWRIIILMFQARRAGASVTLEAITSQATSLGALRVAHRLLERCLQEVTTDH